MKKLFDHVMIGGLLTATLILGSCQKEHEELPQSNEEQTIMANSATASLIERAASKDGSFDNVIDGTPCFSIQFPYTVYANGMDIAVEAMDDIPLAKELAGALQVGGNVFEIIFPVTITYSDFSEVTVNSRPHFEELVAECKGNGTEVIKCVDFVYPMTLFTFDTDRLQTGNVTVESDKELRRFFANLGGNDVMSIDFPISLKLGDGTKVQVNNNTELVLALESAKNDCDEAVHNDDDCKNCTVEQLTSFLSNCASWTIPEFKQDNEPNLAQEFNGFEFSFAQDGTLAVSSNGSASPGTWTANGSGNDLAMTIEVPNYPSFNTTWRLHSLEYYGDWKKVRLTNGNANELVFKGNCGNGGETTVHSDNLRAILKQCRWTIKKIRSKYEEIDRLLESKFSFGTDGSVILSSTGTLSGGVWEVSTTKEGKTALVLNIDNEPDLSFEWPIAELGYDRLKFEALPGYEFTLEKDCDEVDGPVACTMEARAGLNVYVRIEGSQSTSPEGITVTAVDGDYSEELFNLNPNLADYAGAFERKGNYIVTVTKEGYQTFVSEVITVTADQCHVIGRVVQVVLVPQG